MEFEQLVARQPKILIVDDLGSARKIVSKFLTKLGFTNLEEAANGAEAFEKLQAKEFEIVISDWEMPKVTGLELFKAIKESENKSPLLSW